MVEQCIIRRSSKLDHEIRTLVTFPKSVANNAIILLQQIFHILDQYRINMKTQNRTLKDVDAMQRVVVADEILNI